MISGEEPITLWLRQVEAGDEDAARLLWRRYYGELVELARARLGSTSRRVFDEEDVALSVMRCLYEGATRGHFIKVVDRHELWKLLATITIRKVIDKQRRSPASPNGADAICDDFEAAWLGGQEPRIEDFLSRGESVLYDELLRELLRELLLSEWDLRRCHAQRRVCPRRLALRVAHRNDSH